MSSSANIHERLEATHAKCEQERMAAEAEEAELIRQMEEWQQEEERIEASQAAMEMERQETERRVRRVEKEKWKVERKR